jgi:transposase-like protein
VQRFTLSLADAARPCRHRVGERWQVDETYVKVAGQWRYVYRAIDQAGQVIDVFVSPHRALKAARRFFQWGRNAAVIIAGHAFVQNVRRGHYELAAEESAIRRLAVAFDELALAI